MTDYIMRPVGSGVMKIDLIRTIVHITTSGDNIIVNAQPGLEIVVPQMFFTLGGDANLVFKSGSTALSGPMDFSNKGALPRWPEGIYRTGVNEAFIINADNVGPIGGTIWYYLEPPQG